MKKIIFTLLALVLAFSMVGCAAGAPQQNAGKGASTAKAPEVHEYVTYTDLLGNLSFDYPNNWDAKEASISLLVNKETGTGNNISIEFEEYDYKNDPYKNITEESFKTLFGNAYAAAGINIGNLKIEQVKNDKGVSIQRISFFAKSATSPDLTETIYCVLAGNFYYFITLVEVDADAPLKEQLFQSITVLVPTDIPEDAAPETDAPKAE